MVLEDVWKTTYLSLRPWPHPLWEWSVHLAKSIHHYHDGIKSPWRGQTHHEIHGHTLSHGPFDALPSSLIDSLEGLTMWKCRRSWNLESLPTSNTKRGERGVLEVPGLD
jgi:hypothetical protein